MKIFSLFNLDLNKINKAKSRKIKLLICSLLLLTSFTLIGYRTITLASVKKDNISKIVYKNTQPRTLQENVRGNIYDRNNKILATTINTLSLLTTLPNTCPIEKLQRKHIFKIVAFSIYT